MIFGTSQYWVSDSMQWKLNEERAMQSKWDQIAAVVGDDATPATLFNVCVPSLQQSLDAEEGH
ncbi:MAG TPA: hypothetical protein VGN72_02065 [Tepidisphaeraceae bacterium]|jgi:hypothetical protein|nr:hypothetical protein [Tepidisphaeraceae bacterium]